MPDLVVYPDAEAALIAWLPAPLQDRLGYPVDVGDSLRDDDSLALYRTGGASSWLLVDQPTITLETKAVTASRAARIMQMAAALIRDMARSGESIPEIGDDGNPTGEPLWIVGYEEFAGPGNLPRPGDPYRYTMLVSLSVGAQIL